MPLSDAAMRNQRERSVRDRQSRCGAEYQGGRSHQKNRSRAPLDYFFKPKRATPSLRFSCAPTLRRYEVNSHRSTPVYESNKPEAEVNLLVLQDFDKYFAAQITTITSRILGP